MLELLTFPVAVFLGFLAGLGVGGGSLLMLWLTTIVGMKYADARTINLLFFLPSAAVATLFHRKQGSVNIRKILPAVITGCLASALFSFIGNCINTEILKKFFGVMLVFTGLRELLYRPRKAK